MNPLRAKSPRHTPPQEDVASPKDEDTTPLVQSSDPGAKSAGEHSNSEECSQRRRHDTACSHCDSEESADEHSNSEDCLSGRQSADSADATLNVDDPEVSSSDRHGQWSSDNGDEVSESADPVCRAHTVEIAEFSSPSEKQCASSELEQSDASDVEISATVKLPACLR
jgi:hypothetical protein